VRAAVGLQAVAGVDIGDQTKHTQQHTRQLTPPCHACFLLAEWLQSLERRH